MPLDFFLRLLLGHLLLEVVLVVLVDLVNPSFKSFVFLLPVLLIGLPHPCLHVYVRLLVVLSSALLLDLLGQKDPHLLLFLPHSLGPLLLELPLAYLALVVVLG